MFGSLSNKTLDDALATLHKLRADKERETHALVRIAEALMAVGDVAKLEQSLEKKRQDIAARAAAADAEHQSTLSRYDTMRAEVQAAHAAAVAKLQAELDDKRAYFQGQIADAERKANAKLRELDQTIQTAQARAAQAETDSAMRREQLRQDIIQFETVRDDLAAQVANVRAEFARLRETLTTT